MKQFEKVLQKVLEKTERMNIHITEKERIWDALNLIRSVLEGRFEADALKPWEKVVEEK